MVKDISTTEVFIMPVDTAQPIQQIPVTQQGDRHDGVMVKEVVIKQVDTAQFLALSNQIAMNKTWLKIPLPAKTRYN